MKKSLVVFLSICLVCVSFSCSTKGRKKSLPPSPPVKVEEPVKAEEPVIVQKEIIAEEPIREVEEKLVPVKAEPVDPFRYFVIIGSFRNPNNAANFQNQIRSDGFNSVLLRNEAGLYRVSVMGTDLVADAREEIKRIRTKYPRYSDVWLLIQKR